MPPPAVRNASYFLKPSFNVTATSDPLVWQVEERFEHAAAFETHQERVASSEWGQTISGIERRYSVTGL
ncbi:hypothetical protein [Cryobacterium gelidum]|uniref:Antibiotic biosynthesis monooxygenase n=1 Tax=Cryobacterium gelidum TaxID=1259164 RepID=A0A4R9AYX2_9MICO|nr:hypothetical protein [Cryobacterium gelidum]TFD73155.1 hypothetical protein E3T50_03575 [Cryobacterium gelidum]